jgi:integrase
VHPKYVQEALGHANIATTLVTYSHVLPGMGDQAASAMENALGQPVTVG